MKRLKISLTATMAVLLLVLVTGGFAGAQSADASFVRGFLANANPNADGTILAGDTVSVGIFYQNNSTETVNLDYAFVHFDWMPTDSVYGFNLSNYDIQVASGDDYFFPQPINIKIPTTASGNHSYYVGIDAHTATSPAISLTSDPVEFIVIGSGATPMPTNTNSSTNNQGGVPDIAFYGAIIAVVAIVIVLLVVVFTRRKRRPTSKPAEPAPSQPAPTQPEETPSGQDFSI